MNLIAAGPFARYRRPRMGTGKRPKGESGDESPHSKGEKVLARYRWYPGTVCRAVRFPRSGTSLAGRASCMPGVR